MKEISDKHDKLLANAWKDINEECMKHVPVCADIVLASVNVGRFIEVCYKDGDGFTYPEKLNDIITGLFICEMHI